MTILWQALDKAELVWGDRWPSALFGLLKLMCFTLIGFNGQSLHENNESQGDCFILLLLSLRHGLSCSQGLVDWILLAHFDSLLSVSLGE